MNEYNISDYSVFTTASNTTKNLAQKFEEKNADITSCKSIVSDQSIFMGPAADKCSASLDALSTSNKEVVENFTTIEQFLNTVNQTYKSGDNDSLSAILSIAATQESSTSSVSETTLYNYKQLASIQTGGKFTSGYYKAKNGTTLKYYLYEPKFSDGTKEGLPLCVFLHGTGGSSNAMNESFPKAVKSGMNVPGYILFPQSSNNWYNQNKSLNAAAELTKKIATEKKCDMTRISAAGHSNDAMGVHQLVANHPDLFSSYVSYAGASNKNTNLSSISKNNIYSWGFHGTSDKNVNFSNGQKTYAKLESGNPDKTEFTELKGKGHNISSNFWITEYSFNGTKISPIEWLFTTKKSGT